jgi:hypothetical protein
MSIVNPKFDRTAKARLARSASLTILVTALVAACESDRATEIRRPSARASAAKGGPQGGGGSGTLTVTAANPPQASQDTTLDVTVTGTGFTTGARAVWALNGDTTLVHVKATKRLSDTQLVASLIVPVNAPTASYDIEVLLVGGKKGVGAELFTVTLKDPTAIFWFPLADAGLGLQSDHLFTSGDSSAYANGVCGVGSVMHVNLATSGDATMQTNNPTARDHTCSAYPRKLHLILRDDSGNIVTQATTPMFMNVHAIETTTQAIPIGTAVLRPMGMSGDPYCNQVWFKAFMPDGVTPSGADSVIVTRTSPDTWTAQTQPYPHDKALCVNDGHLYHVPVHLTVVTDRALP